MADPNAAARLAAEAARLVAEAAVAQQGPAAAAQGQARAGQGPAAEPGAAITGEDAVLHFLTHFSTFVKESKQAHNNAHIQTASHYELEAAREEKRDLQRQVERDNLEADTWARDISKCDGKSAASIRTWIDEVAQALNHTDAVARLAIRTTTGHLRKDLEAFMGPGDWSRFKWDDIKLYVVANFTTDQDKEELRAEVEVMRQQAGEPTKEYGRRYTDAVELAYPQAILAPQNDIADRYILGGYVRGLSDRNLAERLVRKGLPATLEDTIKAVAKMEDAEKSVQSMFKVPGQLTEAAPTPRQEEPMEINAMARSNNSVIASPLENEVVNMKRQMSGITGQLTQLLAAFTNENEGPQLQPQAQPAPQQPRPGQRSQQPSSRQQPNFAYSKDGRPTCAYCQKKGHLRRECRKQASDIARRTQVQGG